MDDSLRAVLACVLGALLVFHCAQSKATPLTNEQAASIYALAFSQLGGRYKLPELAPVVHVVQQRVVEQKYGCEYCGIIGTMVDGEIWIADKLDFSDPKDASALLHEFVHYFQFKQNGPGTTCQEWLQREKEAYAVEINVALKAGLDTHSLMRSESRYFCDGDIPRLQ